VVSQTEIEFVYKNSIYFALLVHRQEYRNELVYIEYVHFCTPDDALVVRNILSFYIGILSQFVKLPSDTHLRYFTCITIISTVQHKVVSKNNIRSYFGRICHCREFQSTR
jgi:hypothetical protein